MAHGPIHTVLRAAADRADLVQWGDAFSAVALAPLVYSLDRLRAGRSRRVVAEIVPALRAGPVAGALVDRLDALTWLSDERPAARRANINHR